MRRPLILATSVGAVLVAGLLAVPAVGAVDDPLPTGPTACPGAGTGDGHGMGYGTGHEMGYGMGYGMGHGHGMTAGGAVTDPLAGLARGTLTDGQKKTLAATAEEEKLAHDVYVALAKSSGDARFTHVAAAETRHLAQVRALMARYGVSDPTAGRAEGVFAGTTVQKQYTDLVARGSASPAAALAVGRDVERADLAQLARAGDGVTAQDVRTVYGRLAMASRMHLRAFGG